MMDHCNRRPFLRQVSFVRAQFAQSSGLPFSEVLSASVLADALREHAIRWLETIYTPLVTLWVLLSQVISADSSCRAAVARLVAHLSARGEKPCSSRTGAYCTARKNLPEGFFAQLVRAGGAALAKKAAADWLWKGRQVLVFDGSTVSMPDTPANQAAYPQPRSQKPGVGFPLARIAAVFSLACGAVLDLGICRYRGKGQSELGLLRQLWHRFPSGSILLADRYICSYFEIALLRRQGINSVCRLHQQRRVDFRRGQRLGPDDHCVEWLKPRRPEWMDQATYDSLPATMSMREVRLRVDRPGFRVRELVVATTLLDAETFSRGDLVDLYRARWHAELDLRSLKETMHMDVLRCKTPELVRKEIWTHLLAYNLIRTVMAQAAVQHGIQPRTISFKGAIQTLQAFHPMIQQAPASQLPTLYEHLFHALLNHRVGNRPDRYEPRARKRRPKPYPLLMVPRAEARKALCRNH
jgi:hypothetical protein